MTALIHQTHFTDETHPGEVLHADLRVATHPAATSHADGAASLAPLAQSAVCDSPQAGTRRGRAAPAAGGGQDDPRAHNTPTERHTVFTARRQSAFLKSLQLFGNVRLACRAACVSAQTAYRARHASPGFARLWDAACLAARDHAEQVLADRAINGVEEAVFYHGEEVARRRRYDSRLLLAHLARLDRLEARAEVVEVLAMLDAVIAVMEEGGDVEAIMRVPAQAGTSCDGAHGPEAPACAGARTGAGAEAENHAQDPVPPVPSCRECGGACADPEAKLTQADCQWLGNRLERMYAERPAQAPWPHELARDGWDSGEIEWAQLLAFEAGEARWWEAMPEGAGAAQNG